MLRVLLLALIAGGCIDADLVPCQFGRACARGYVCDEQHRGCVTPGQVAACNGIADGSDCTADVVTGGGCFDGICLPRGCGNGVIEPGEACDDHNVVSHDGCRDDCRSDETCGNGVVDQDEDCDDGNLISRDGCDSRCLAETSSWTIVPIGPTRLDRQFGVYDVARHRFVYATTTEVWEWDGASWSVTPAGLGNITGVYYDAQRAHVVALASPSFTAFDLYAWDGVAWTRISSGTGPTCCTLAVAYDLTQNQVEILTAHSGTDPDRLWTIDQAGVWQTPLVTPDLTPSNGNPTIAEYDPDKKQLVVMVPSNGGVTTWTYDTAWSSRQDGFTVVNAMTVDTVARRLVLRSGKTLFTRSNGAFLGIAGTSPCTDPLSISGPLYFDAATSTIVQLVDDDSAVCRRTGATWTQDAVLAPQTARAIAPDPDHDRFLAIADDGTTWSWTGSWHVVATTGRAFSDYATAYDPSRHRALLVGSDANTSEIVTLEYTANGWSELDASGPEAGALAFEPTTGTMLLFAGTVYRLGANATWTATSITPLSLSQSVAYDVRNNVLCSVVLTPQGGALGELIDNMWLDTQIGPRNASVLVADQRIGGIVVLIADAGWRRIGSTWDALPDFPIATQMVDTATYDPVTGNVGVLAHTIGQGYVELVLSYASATPLETCAPNEDADGDGLFGCDDPDCYWTCSTCVPYASCP